MPGADGNPQPAATLHTIVRAAEGAAAKLHERGLLVAPVNLPDQLAQAPPLQQLQPQPQPQPSLRMWQRGPLGFLQAYGKPGVRQLAVQHDAAGFDLYHPSILLCLQAMLFTSELQQQEPAAVACWQQLSEQQRANVRQHASPEALRAVVLKHDADLRATPQPTSAQWAAYKRHQPADVIPYLHLGCVAGLLAAAGAAQLEAAALPLAERGSAAEVCQRLAGELERAAARVGPRLASDRERSMMQQLLALPSTASWAQHRATLVQGLAAVPAGPQNDTEQRREVQLAGSKSANLLPEGCAEVAYCIWQNVSSERGGKAPRTAEAAAAGSECYAYVPCQGGGAHDLCMMAALA